MTLRPLYAMVFTLAALLAMLTTMVSTAGATTEIDGWVANDGTTVEEVVGSPNVLQMDTTDDTTTPFGTSLEKVLQGHFGPATEVSFEFRLSEGATCGGGQPRVYFDSGAFYVQLLDCDDAESGDWQEVNLVEDGTWFGDGFGPGGGDLDEAIDEHQGTPYGQVGLVFDNPQARGVAEFRNLTVVEPVDLGEPTRGIPYPGQPEEPRPPDDFDCSLDLFTYHMDPTSADPARAATRAHINVDVACVVEYLTGEAIGSAPDPDFDDFEDLGGQEQEAVAYLAERDITLGFEDGTFGGADTVLRQHTASFVWRAVEYADANGATSVDHDPDALGSDLYVDVRSSNVHDANIGQASTAGLWEGVGADLYEPRQDVSNQQTHRVMLRWLEAQQP